MKILFVCTGNICRSPMAEMMLRQKTDQVEVASAGIMAYDGGEISHEAAMALAANGIAVDLEFRSSHLTVRHLEEYDLILAMTHQHKAYIRESSPAYKEKVWVLPEYVVDDKNDEILDPYGFDYAMYEAVYKQLDGLLDKLIEKLGL